MTLEELKKLAGVGVYDQTPKELWFSRPYMTGPVKLKSKKKK